MKKLSIFHFFLCIYSFIIASETPPAAFEDNFFSNRKTPVKIQKDKDNFCDMYRSYFMPLKQERGIVFFEGTYLYWKPSAKIPYATTMDIVFPHGLSDSSSNNKVRTNKKIQYVNFNMQSGYKIDLGFYLPKGGWTTSVTYQFIQKTNENNAKGANRDTTSSLNESKALSSIWRTIFLSNRPSFFDVKLTSASATQFINYKVFDWILRKSLYWKSKFGFSPYLGIRGAWIRNELKVLYDGVSIAGSNLSSIKDDARIQANYRGWGVRSGLESSWLLGCGFEVFGNSSLSLLWGNFDFRHNEIFIAAINERRLPGDVTSYNSWGLVQSSYQLALGVNWGKHFWQDSVYVGLKIAYEMNTWPQLLQVRRMFRSPDLGRSNIFDLNTFDDLSQNSVSFNGLTLGAKLDF